MERMTATEGFMKAQIEQLEEENKKLKELRAYADNLDSENDNQAIEIEELKKENRKLKEELSKYKKQYEHSMGEDDELIYEEGLYD